MMTPKRPHLLDSLRFFRYGFLLCLVPMVQALFRFDMEGLLIALWQDAAILAVCLALSLALWAAARISVTPQAVVFRQGIGFHLRQTFARASIAVVEIERPLYCRFVGAARVRLYFKNYAAPHRLTVYLTKRDAAFLSETLMPVKQHSGVFTPAGFERLALVMLSANAVTTSIFLWMGVQRLNDYLEQDLEQIALEHFTRLEVFIERLLPAGSAFLVALAFCLASLTFCYSFFHTFGFSCGRSGGVIISRGGFFTKIERRVLASSVTACRVRVTPAARLLHRRPVYLTAGWFGGGDVPLMVYKAGQEHIVQALLPDFMPPARPLGDTQGKSVNQYLWQPATALALSLGLCGVAMNVLPGLLGLLGVLVALSAGCLLVSLEGFGEEGIADNPNRTLGLIYTRFFTRYEVCIFTPDRSFAVRQNPFSVNAGRSNVFVRLPAHHTFRVRGVRKARADALGWPQ